MKFLLEEIRKCTYCEPMMGHEARPIVSASTKSKIILIGQAPGRKVHESGIPWQDKSGETLRAWLGIESDEFYDVEKIALIPMGFCYPGKGKSGDLPPRKECAPLWHKKLIGSIESVKLTILIGQYAQKHYLTNRTKRNLTETVKNYNEYLPSIFPLPHPSPRNGIWIRKNEWFESQVIPDLQKYIQMILK